LLGFVYLRLARALGIHLAPRLPGGADMIPRPRRHRDARAAGGGQGFRVSGLGFRWRRRGVRTDVSKTAGNGVRGDK
jgi:hypothetical protein